MRRDAGNYCLKGGADVRDFLEQRRKLKIDEKRGEVIGRKRNGQGAERSAEVESVALVDLDFSSRGDQMEEEQEEENVQQRKKFRDTIFGHYYNNEILQVPEDAVTKEEISNGETEIEASTSDREKEDIDKHFSRGENSQRAEKLTELKDTEGQEEVEKEESALNHEVREESEESKDEQPSKIQSSSEDITDSKEASTEIPFELEEKIRDLDEELEKLHIQTRELFSLYPVEDRTSCTGSKHRNQRELTTGSEDTENARTSDGHGQKETSEQENGGDKKNALLNLFGSKETTTDNANGGYSDPITMSLAHGPLAFASETTFARPSSSSPSVTAKRSRRKKGPNATTTIRSPNSAPVDGNSASVFNFFHSTEALSDSWKTCFMRPSGSSTTNNGTEAKGFSFTETGAADVLDDIRQKDNNSSDQNSCLLLLPSSSPQDHDSCEAEDHRDASTEPILQTTEQKEEERAGAKTFNDDGQENWELSGLSIVS